MDWLDEFRSEVGDSALVELSAGSAASEDAYNQAISQPDNFSTTGCPSTSTTCAGCLSTSCCSDTCSCGR